MQIQVNSKSPARRELLLAVASLYAKELNIEASNFALTIDSVKGFRKGTGWNRAVFQARDRELAMAVDCQLSIEQTLITLAHEMVHVKQRVRGQLRYFTDRRGKTVTVWMGKVYKTEYYESPWELEAFSRERVLANRVAQIVGKK